MTGMNWTKTRSDHRMRRDRDEHGWADAQEAISAAILDGLTPQQRSDWWRLRPALLTYEGSHRIVVDLRRLLLTNSHFVPKAKQLKVLVDQLDGKRMGRKHA